MTSCGNDKQTIFEALQQFLDVFRSAIVIVNLVKCGRWWKDKRLIMTSFEDNNLSFSQIYEGNCKSGDQV